MIITFDDGFAGVSTHAVIVAASGFNASVFVVTEKVGKTCDWTEMVGRGLLSMDWTNCAVSCGNAGLKSGSHRPSIRICELLRYTQARPR